MKNLIKLADLKDLLPLYDREEITISRLAELLNEKANTAFEKPQQEVMFLPKTKKGLIDRSSELSEDVIGEKRTIPKGSRIWSIKNQANMILDSDHLVEIKHTCIGSDYVFVKPIQVIFDSPGMIPGIIGKGVDEWGLSYSDTLPNKELGGRDEKQFF